DPAGADHATDLRARDEGDAVEPKGAGNGMSLEPRRRRRIPRFARNGVMLLIVVFVVIYFVVPAFTAAHKKLYVLGHVNPWLLVLGIGLECGAQLAYAYLTTSLLPKGALPLSKVLRINLSALAVSHVLPGGTAGGTPVGYKLMTSNDVAGSDVGVAAATQGIGSAVVLNVIFWLALVISIPLRGFSKLNKFYAWAAIFGVLLLGLFALLSFTFTKGAERSTRVVRAVARRIPHVSEDAAERLLGRVTARISTLGRDRRLLGTAIGWAAANWLFDAATLWACLAAFGALMNPIYLLVVYGLANILAAIPITPSGLGVVEAAATSLLVSFGVTYNKALFGVLAWRLVSFWLPIPVGAGSYVSLRVQRGASMRERRAALSAMTQEAHPDVP
ncbi:MAG: lysylphosphatidylglycerol synthase transmembrane domain-containing protein, partial [Acidimicrobiales bacterium]